MKSLASLGAVILLLGSPALGSPGPQEGKAAAGPACAECHAEQAAASPGNPHLRVSNDLVCASCHGDASAHAAAAGQEPVPYNGKGAAGTVQCTTCHKESKENRSYRAGAHATGDTVNCGTCHSIHTPDAKSAHLMAKPQLVLCGSCHRDAATSFKSKPFAHRIGRGGMECSSCHDPHGRMGKDGILNRGLSGELPCLTCHTEKRGPNVFEHVNGVTGDCLTCHEAHGSSNQKRLTRATVKSLCLECHSAFSAAQLGSQPPSIHDLTLPRYANCTVCHVAVHGSQRSPALLK